MKNEFGMEGGGNWLTNSRLFIFRFQFFHVSNKQRHDKNKQYLRKIVHVPYTYIQCVLKKNETGSFIHKCMTLTSTYVLSPPSQIIEQLDLESKHHFVYFYEPNYSLLPQDHKYRQNFIELLHVCFLFCACFFSFLKL